MTDNMIERVAGAVGAASYTENGIPITLAHALDKIFGGSLGFVLSDAFLEKIARAAIEAMRDADTAMFHAWRSVNCHSEGERTYFIGDFGNWLACHDAMIVAALEQARL